MNIKNWYILRISNKFWKSIDKLIFPKYKINNPKKSPAHREFICWMYIIFINFPIVIKFTSIEPQMAVFLKPAGFLKQIVQSRFLILRWLAWFSEVYSTFYEYLRTHRNLDFEVSLIFETDWLTSTHSLIKKIRTILEPYKCVSQIGHLSQFVQIFWLQ